MATKFLECNIQVMHVVDRFFSNVEIRFSMQVCPARPVMEDRATFSTYYFYRPVIYLTKRMHNMLGRNLIVYDFILFLYGQGENPLR